MEEEEKVKKKEMTKVFQEQDKLYQNKTKDNKDTKEKNLGKKKTSPEMTSRSNLIFAFKTETVNIEELEDGTIFCGTCKTTCIRILAHLRNNQICVENLNMKEFIGKWKQFKTNQRKKKSDEKIKVF